MKLVKYTDAAGRQWKTLLPDSAPESEAPRGVPYGPPSLARLGLPLTMEVRLHNGLFERGIFTAADLRGREDEVARACLAAVKLDAIAVMGLYD